MIGRTFADRGGAIEVGASSVEAPQTQVIHGLDERLLSCEQELLRALGGQGIHFVSEAQEGVYVYYRSSSVEGTMSSVQAVVSRQYRDVTSRDADVAATSRGITHGLSGPYEAGTPVDTMIAEALSRLLQED